MPSLSQDMRSESLSLAYSIADQNFVRTKSVGILNLSLQLAEALAPRLECRTTAAAARTAIDMLVGIVAEGNGPR